MNFKTIKTSVFAFLTALMLASCSTVDDGEGLQSVLEVQPQAEPKPYALTRIEPSSSGLPPLDDPNAVTTQANGYSEPIIDGQITVAQTGNTSSELAGNNFGNGLASSNNGSDFAASRPPFEPLPPRASKTYLINGLASSVKSIGYGFTNLSKKIPNSELYNYASFIESSTVIRRNITRRIKAEYKADPDIAINMIGISFGANIVTLIAADLDRAGIPVNYLVTMDGPAMVAVRDNVTTVDNFTCSGFNCFRTKSKLARSNKKSKYATFKIASSHIPLANNDQVHERILSQLNTSRSQPAISTASQ